MDSGKRALVIYAHPEKKSFCNSMKMQTIETLEKQGMEVMVSDLYEMEWDPVSGPKNFKDQQDKEFYKQPIEEAHALKTDSFSDDIKAEQEKILKADLLVFVFPLWWGSVPSIMKGWIDRCFAREFAYGPGLKLFEDGPLKGRRAVCAITTGGPPVMFSEMGVLQGHMDNEIMYNMTHGVFFFTGMTPLKTFVSYGAAHVGDEKRKEYLNDLNEYISKWNEHKPIEYKTLAGSPFAPNKKPEN
eukprot:TRINITY_DN557_c0_g1_i12.p1 TRINITY_DN557_c0_g1~~TRINITY_DN557_c0_g1_i12.p1  ORF type:complete len:243 (-),score=72.65 TRINITY_DN557_c0_g1_i12:85-813(-)